MPLTVGHLARRPVAAAARVPARRLPAGAARERALDRVLVGALAFVDDPARGAVADVPGLRQLRRARRPAQRADGRRTSPALADAVDTVQRVILIASLLTLAFVLVRRYRSASAPLRRVLAPVLAGAAGARAARRRLPARQARRAPRRPLYAIALLVLTAVPLIFLARPAARAPRPLGDRRPARRPARARRARRAARRARPRAARPDARARLLGARVRAPTSAPTASRSSCPTDGGRVATFVERGGDARRRARPRRRRCATSRELVGAVTSAAGIALENERLQADLRARLSDLRASRARIVEAGDTRAPQARARPPRRRAAAARVALASCCALVAGKLPPDSPEARAARPAPATSSPPRWRSCASIARGIHPAVLSDHGLPVALESLAARAPVRVDARRRRSTSACREPVEVAAYYLVAEGLTNVAKYAEAEQRDASTSRATTARSSSRSPTTARAAPTPRAAPGCAGWPTASRRSTGA